MPNQVLQGNLRKKVSLKFEEADRIGKNRIWNAIELNFYLPDVFSTSKAQQTRTWSPEGLLLEIQNIDDYQFEPENKKSTC